MLLNTGRVPTASSSLYFALVFLISPVLFQDERGVSIKGNGVPKKFYFDGVAES